MNKKIIKSIECSHKTLYITVEQLNDKVQIVSGKCTQCNSENIMQVRKVSNNRLLYYGLDGLIYIDKHVKNAQQTEQNFKCFDCNSTINMQDYYQFKEVFEKTPILISKFDNLVNSLVS